MDVFDDADARFGWYASSLLSEWDRPSAVEADKKKETVVAPRRSVEPFHFETPRSGSSFGAPRSSNHIRSTAAGARNGDCESLAPVSRLGRSLAQLVAMY